MVDNLIFEKNVTIVGLKNSFENVLIYFNLFYNYRNRISILFFVYAHILISILFVIVVYELIRRSYQ